jgi:N-acetylglucosamine-6-phosphate deacetylase
MLRVSMRVKGLARTILVTDATAGAAAAPDLYTLGDGLTPIRPVGGRGSANGIGRV